VKHSVNLAAYGGQTVTVQIRAETNGTGLSSLFVDDFSFQASAALYEAPAAPADDGVTLQKQ